MIIKYGIELETAVKQVNFHIGEYHEGKKISKYWKAEEDNSLRSLKNYICVEFVSYPFSYKNRQLVYNDFKNTFFKYNMDDFEINNSMGLHLHFSIQHKRRIIKYNLNIPLEITKQIKNYFFELYKKNNLKGIDYIKNHYYRSYAKKLTFHNVKDRYVEFNTNNITKGAEWRSFNVNSLQQYEREGTKPEERLGILFKIIDLGITAINSILTISSNKNKKEYYKYNGEIRINTNIKITDDDKIEIIRCIPIINETEKELIFINCK